MGPAHGIDVDVEVRRTAEQLADHYTSLETGQCRPQAVMDPVTKLDMAAGITPDIERPSMLEGSVVAREIITFALLFPGVLLIVVSHSDFYEDAEPPLR